MSHPFSTVRRMEFTIDCSTCLRGQSGACQDCVVTFLTGREPGEAVVVEASEFAALRRLADAGLIPSLRHDPEAPHQWVTGEESDEPGEGSGGLRRVV